jgi:hypothetical protein
MGDLDSMDEFQRILFSPFPRAVASDVKTGQLRQWVVHSEGEFMAFLRAIDNDRNGYASISWRPIGGNLLLDKVSLDFDTLQKPDWPIFDGEILPEDEMIARMRNDPEVADAVLGQVIEDATEVVKRSNEEGISIIGVFSGFGIHIHQLYSEKVNPDKQIDTTGRKYVSDLNLETADVSPIGDVRRQMRVPNVQRVHIETNGEEMLEQRPCGLYTIPLIADDFENLTATKLLEMARERRYPDPPDLTDLPHMKAYDNYIEDYSEAKQEDQQRLNESVVADNDGMLQFMLEEYLQMPCMYERIQQIEPEHAVRLNCTVLLLNVGFQPNEVVDLFSQIGWSDWNRKVTKKQVSQIYRKGYSDMSCASCRKKGLCTRADEPKECQTYGWSGGKAEWK